MAGNFQHFLKFSLNLNGHGPQTSIYTKRHQQPPNYSFYKPFLIIVFRLYPWSKCIICQPFPHQFPPLTPLIIKYFLYHMKTMHWGLDWGSMDKVLNFPLKYKILIKRASSQIIFKWSRMCPF